MKEGHYCANCHPFGDSLKERHEKDMHNPVYKSWWKICDECKLLKPVWYWAGNEHERDVS
jgi:hypothetical protein